MPILGSCLNCYKLPSESIKGHTFEKLLLLHEYQRNDIENCLVSLPICPVGSCNLPGFYWPFLPIKMGDFLQKILFENMQKRMKTPSKISLVLLPSNNDIWICSCILSSWEEEIPLNKLFNLGEDLSTGQEDSTF